MHLTVLAATIQRLIGGVPIVAGGAPLILFTDITAGPTTGGENSKGCYLSIYGLNLGNFSDYGVTNFVTIGGVNVDNYRCLVDPVGSVATTFGFKRLTVQVGAIGTPAAGTPLAISVTVNGVGPINATSGGNYLMPTINADALTFTPQPGSIIFVDPSTGNNANAGTIASPLADLQTTAGTGGAMHTNTGANGTDGTQPGTHIILRNGTYTAVGLNNRWCDMFRITGTAPTGAANRGPIVVTSYPGAAGANAPELAQWAAPSGKGGGFNGNDSTRAIEVSTSYGGFTGWCKYIHVSNVKVASNATAAADGGPFNLQNNGQFIRLVNVEATWPSTVTGASHGKSAGIEGNPKNGRFFSVYIHDINGDTAFNENHGIYMDGSSAASDTVAMDNEFGWIHIENIGAGSGVQFFDGVNGFGMRNNIMHHVLIKNTNKHGLNVADNTRSLTFHDMLIIDVGESGIRFTTDSVVAANGLYGYNCVVYGWARVVLAGTPDRYAFTDEATIGTAPASGRIENCIFAQTASHSGNTHYQFVNLNSGKVALANNQWNDPDARLTTKPAGDTLGAFGDPLFTNAAGGDFSLQSGSPCKNAGTTPLNTRAYDFSMNPSPFGASVDRGAFERQS